MSTYRKNDIEALSEQLGSLQITDEALESTNNYTNKMSNTPAPAYENVQAVVLKSIVLDPEWFDGNRTKFEDW